MNLNRTCKAFTDDVAPTYNLPVSGDIVRGTFLNKSFFVTAVFNDDGTINELETDKRVYTYCSNLYFRTLGKITASLNPELPHGIVDETGMDVVYCNGQEVRRDFNIMIPASKDMVSTLLSSQFRDDVYEDTLTADTIPCVIGMNSSYRPPYVNPVISWYKFCHMNEQIVNKFGVDTNRFKDLYPWYGRKFDLSTGKQLLKIVYGEYDMLDQPKPILPKGYKFYSMYYDEDKNLGSLVDVYTVTSPQIMRQFCADWRLKYPVPDDANVIADRVTIYSVVYDINTLKYVTVKAYDFIGDSKGVPHYVEN